MTSHGLNDATKDDDTLIKYFTGEREIANIALATGEVSGAWVLDEDRLGAVAELEAKHGVLPKTWLQQTGGGGRQFFFKHDDRSRTLKNSVKGVSGIDVRATGGYALLPPSQHKSGGVYSWIVAPWECEVALAPDWLIDLLPTKCDPKPAVKAKDETADKGDNKGDYTPLTKSLCVASAIVVSAGMTAKERAIAFLEKCPPAISGQAGHNVTFSTCCRLNELFGKELTSDEIVDALEEWNLRCEPPWTYAELARKVNESFMRVLHKTFDDTPETTAVSTELLEPKPTPVPETVVEDDDEWDGWPALSQDAYQGIVGEIVKAIEPETEADSVGILVTLLTAIGNIFGTSAHVCVGADVHYGNLFTALVGDTASGKGQAWSIVRALLEKCDPEFKESVVNGGLSSGEGLIEHLADPQDDGGFVSGFPLKRCLFMESEFAKPITAMRRENNTLSPILRSAWDRQTLTVLTRGKSKLRASNAFVSIVTHITPDELTKLLAGSVETTNGFSNRFLWVVVRSTKSLPYGRSMNVMDVFVPRLKAAVERAKNIGEVVRSDEANHLWGSVYDSLKQSGSGSYGRAIERARPQVVRLSLIYALLDGSQTIEVDHLKAALAVWRYCDASADRIFGKETAVNDLENRIFQYVKENSGCTTTEIRRSVSSRLSKEAFDSAIQSLLTQGSIREEREGKTHRFFLTHPSGAFGAFASSGGRANAPNTPNAPHTSPVIPISAAGREEQMHQTQHAPDWNAIGSLCEWANVNAVSFVEGDGGVWVTPDSERHLTETIRRTIRENQSFIRKTFPVDACAVDASVWADRIRSTPDDQLDDVDRYSKELLTMNEPRTG